LALYKKLTLPATGKALAMKGLTGQSPQSRYLFKYNTALFDAHDPNAVAPNPRWVPK
jgi:hypothetical protein